ncbi:uncharacterized protein TNCV_1209451 [Trichonephila clavipes]|nr:uncharacterized protein TNCV_1209451 [Trichonephila clavipes]
MIANYVNDQHDTWDQFLREFAYAIRTPLNETTGKPPAELFLGRKLITPFQKLVMVSDGTEFAVGDIERLFDEARRNTKVKHEKWEKYYNTRRRNVQIKVNDWVLIKTHPLSSATKKVVAKFKPKFEGPYTVLGVKNNNIVIWRSEKRLMVNVDQVRIYRHRKCDEMEIRTGSSNSNSSRHESSSFDRVQRRSNESQYGRKKGSDKERPNTEETVIPNTSSYILRPRSGRSVVSRPTMEMKTQQGGPVRARKSKAPTLKSKQDQATRMPDEEVINNKRTRKGKDERILAEPCVCLWRS